MEVPISADEPIVVRAVPYFQKLFSVFQSYSRRSVFF